MALAHIGSPNVFFEGPAGSYPIRVTVQTPLVVPGLAQIHIRVESGAPTKVTVLPVYSRVGTKGAPPPDVATLVPGETNLYTAQLWLMDSGAYSVFVDVTGAQGRGTAIVPVNSVATQRLTMPRGMAIMFLFLGLFLLALLVSVIGAACREGTLSEGQFPSASRRRLATGVMVVSGVVAVGLVNFGSRWWNYVDDNFLHERLYQAMAVSPSLLTADNGAAQLSLSLTQPMQRRSDHSELIPDHGQLMHLFLIRKPAGDAFAHLHPVRSANGGERTFVSALPLLPEGDYELYADITHATGLSETMTNQLRVSRSSNATGTKVPLSSPDDSWSLEPPKPTGNSMLVAGLKVTPQFTGPFKANQDLSLRFEVTTPAGTNALLEPYLGMYGHVIIQAEDGSVFTHLHPLGTISMAAQRQFAEREQAGYLANQPLDLLCSPARPMLSFPYAFPKAGSYRLWLQIKSGGEILTVPFLVKVV